MIRAVLQVQQGWLVFQRGNISGALGIFDEAAAVLGHTDHWIALGNIESARGRVVRRGGDYTAALEHFRRAVAFYERRHPHHPNLARTITNLAFVKRLLALQLKRHIDTSAAHRSPGGLGHGAKEVSLRPLHQQYQALHGSALADLQRAESICKLHGHQSGLAAALLNAAFLHLDVGDLDVAEQEADRAYAIGKAIHGSVLMARGEIVRGLIENARLEELLGHPGDAPAFARRAKQHCVEAVKLAETTQNRRVMANAHLALGEVAANSFFRDYELARRCVEAASQCTETQDADYVVDELNLLRAKLLRNVGLDATLKAWSEGVLGGKSLQQVTEAFAELVVSKVWLREGRRTARVAKLLSTSPKKVRRLVRWADLPENTDF